MSRAKPLTKFRNDIARLGTIICSQKEAGEAKSELDELILTLEKAYAAQIDLKPAENAHWLTALISARLFADYRNTISGYYTRYRSRINNAASIIGFDNRVKQVMRQFIHGYPGDRSNCVWDVYRCMFPFAVLAEQRADIEKYGRLFWDEGDSAAEAKLKQLLHQLQWYGECHFTFEYLQQRPEEGTEIPTWKEWDVLHQREYWMACLKARLYLNLDEGMKWLAEQLTNKQEVADKEELQTFVHKFILAHMLAYPAEAESNQAYLEGLTPLPDDEPVRVSIADLQQEIDTNGALYWALDTAAQAQLEALVQQARQYLQLASDDYAMETTADDHIWSDWPVADKVTLATAVTTAQLYLDIEFGIEMFSSCQDALRQDVPSLVSRNKFDTAVVQVLKAYLKTHTGHQHCATVTELLRTMTVTRTAAAVLKDINKFGQKYWKPADYVGEYPMPVELKSTLPAEVNFLQTPDRQEAGITLPDWTTWPQAEQVDLMLARATLQMYELETASLWKGFIHSVGRLTNASTKKRFVTAIQALLQNEGLLMRVDEDVQQQLRRWGAEIQTKGLSAAEATGPGVYCWFCWQSRPFAKFTPHQC